MTVQMISSIVCPSTCVGTGFRLRLYLNTKPTINTVMPMSSTTENEPERKVDGLGNLGKSVHALSEKDVEECQPDENNERTDGRQHHCLQQRALVFEMHKVEQDCRRLDAGNDDGHGHTQPSKVHPGNSDCDGGETEKRQPRQDIDAVTGVFLTTMRIVMIQFLLPVFDQVMR